MRKLLVSDNAGGARIVETDADSASRAERQSRRVLIELAVAIVAGAILKALEYQFQGKWSWITGIVFIAITLYAMVVAFRFVGSRARRLVLERRIERQIRDGMLAASAAFSDAMSQSFAKSAGNILNQLFDAKAVDARLVHAYVAHLGTLLSAGRAIAADVRIRRLSARDGLHRLSDAHRAGAEDRTFLSGLGKPLAIGRSVRSQARAPRQTGIP